MNHSIPPEDSVITSPIRPLALHDFGSCPAFPCEGGEQSGLYASPGLTKREYYAGLAMQGLLAGNDEDGFRSRFDPKDGAKIAVEWADAMIAALNKKEGAV